jgi:hypothetical protein
MYLILPGHIICYFSFPVQILEGKYPSLPRGSGWYLRYCTVPSYVVVYFSVADPDPNPDPLDPHVCGPPGSRSFYH